MNSIISHVLITLNIGGSIQAETYCYSDHLILRKIHGLPQFEGEFTAWFSLFDLKTNTVTHFAPDLTLAFKTPIPEPHSGVMGWKAITNIHVSPINVVNIDVNMDGLSCIEVVRTEKHTSGFMAGLEVEKHHLLCKVDLDNTISSLLGFQPHQLGLSDEFADYRYIFRSWAVYQDEGHIGNDPIRMSIQYDTPPKYSLELLQAVPLVSEEVFQARMK